MGSEKGNPGKKTTIYTWQDGGYGFRLLKVTGKTEEIVYPEQDNFGTWIKSRTADMAAFKELARLIKI